MSATVEVTNAGLPIVARHASSSMSTTVPGQRPAVSCRNSSGDNSSNGIWRPTRPVAPVTRTGCTRARVTTAWQSPSLDRGPQGLFRTPFQILILQVLERLMQLFVTTMPDDLFFVLLKLAI